MPKFSGKSAFAHLCAHLFVCQGHAHHYTCRNVAYAKSHGKEYLICDCPRRASWGFANPPTAQDMLLGLCISHWNPLYVGGFWGYCFPLHVHTTASGIKGGNSLKSFVHCVSLCILCFLVIRCLSCPSPTTFLVRMHLRQEIIRNTNGMPSTSQSTQGSCNDACGRKREKETSFLRALVTKELPTAREDQLQECATEQINGNFRILKWRYCIVLYHTWEGVTRKVVVSDVITRIVVVMWL